MSVEPARLRPQTPYEQQVEAQKRRVTVEEKRQDLFARRLELSVAVIDAKVELIKSQARFFDAVTERIRTGKPLKTEAFALAERTVIKA